ncbi:MAG: zinc ribbon domain-containing protein [Bacteroidaceae bacterium]|nr:zinc ribbon domain-containing protein [Bacteroidaceae bacterium]
MKVLASILIIFTLSSCQQPPLHQNRYYGESYNFLVKADSVQLLRFLPSEASLFQDTLFIYKGDIVAVADILTSDSLDITADITWVQLLKDDTTFGWIEETHMQRIVVPDDPISQAIDYFSDNHLPLFSILTVTMLIAYFLRKQYRKGMPMVILNDIPSAYPALLTLIVAFTASLYSSIQMFLPEQWQYYYYNPTLNPLALFPILSNFLTCVWIILIMFVASLLEIIRYLKAYDAILYTISLITICSINYVLYTQLTLLYIGFPLLLAHIILVIYHLKTRKAINSNTQS